MNHLTNPELIKATLNEGLIAHLQRSKQASFDHGIPNLEQRRQDLNALKALILENQERIIEAINQDYGNRSRHETLFAEIISVTDGINHTLKHLKKWMKPQRRGVDISMFPGAKNRLLAQPLGVVGVIVPWNFPLNLSFMPLCCAFAAGNRAMVKMSENSIALSRLLIDIAPKYFAQDKLSFFEETGEVGVAFSKLPFDLLMFTGSGQTGRKVMAAAANNLTPVILELGGKAPAVIDPDYSLKKAVQRIFYVKQLNAGQICLNVDYVFVHDSQREDFIRLAKQYAAKHCADIEHTDYTAIIDERSFSRLQATLEDAKAKGATVISLSDQAPNPATRKMPMHLVLDTNEDMIIRQRETFGPLLMVLPYSEPQQVVDYVRQHDRPLAFYPFSDNSNLVQFYIDQTMSGGVSVNDALFHVAQHELPFGGVGASGMGHYHGYEGFVAFSKMRPVFYQTKRNLMPLLAPPYGKFADKVFALLQRLKS